MVSFVSSSLKTGWLIFIWPPDSLWCWPQCVCLEPPDLSDLDDTDEEVDTELLSLLNPWYGEGEDDGGGPLHRYEFKASKWTLDTYGWDKQIMNTSQYVLYSYSSRGTEIARKESVALLPKPKPELNPQCSCRSLLYTMIDLHKQYNSDLMIMMSQSSASSFRWEKPLHMCSRVMLTCLCSHRCPWPTPLYILTWTAK